MSLLTRGAADNLAYDTVAPLIFTERVMPKAKSSFSPLQLISPFQLVFCLGLFFLPWIELQCTAPADLMRGGAKPDGAKKSDAKKTTIGMMTQSGLQIATGGRSLSSDMKMLESMGGDEGKKGSKNEMDEIGSAPLLFAFPVLVIAGIVLALVPMSQSIRQFAVAGCCGAALGVVMLQAAIGFPLENYMKKEFEKKQKEDDARQKEFEKNMPPGMKVEKTEKKEKIEDILRVAWKFPLYLTFMFLIGATGTAFLVNLGGGGGRSRSGRKGRRDDDYDDWDDDEDDRPRKKSRRDEDDDEDDRPRKKAEPMSLDDDDRPKKKSRRDDDEDDRPRKKKPVEPEFEMPAPLPPPPPAAPAAPAGPNPFDFDSQEQPKKKPRRRDDDDDDYDDRPRKKRRRDDDD